MTTQHCTTKLPPTYMIAGGVLFLLNLLLVASASAQAVASGAKLDVPGYGPGVAGLITRGPLNPVCQPAVPCSGPYANARLLILDRLNGDNIAGTAVTNAHGNFLVSVPPGDYVAHVQVVDFPSCPEATVHVGQKGFKLIAIDCDTGIR